MAEILPFRAWRYNPELSASIAKLSSPLFDVVTEKQREKLYQNPYNSIHLAVPEKGVSSEETAALLAGWKSNGIILQDPKPAIYVYYQYFSFPGADKEYCRKGFIANIKAYDWNDSIVLRHENTIPKAVNDRLDLLRDTLLNVSPTHGLYTDPALQLEKYMDESMQNPVYCTEDYQGVKDVLSVIDQPELIREFLRVLQDKQVILADGHHRYEASLLYRKEQMLENPAHSGTEGYNYHLMYLTNTESGNIRVLPTHRLVSGINNFNETNLLKQLEKYFYIEEKETPYELDTIILGKKWTFGLIFPNTSYLIRLKPEVFEQLNWKMPPVIKQLDLTVLHFFIFEKGLGIPGKEQRSTEHIDFDRNFACCIAKVSSGKAQMAVITRDISMEDIKEVCYSGFTMPQKSTYFYPKVISGYLFSSIKEDEFNIPSYTRL